MKLNWQIEQCDIENVQDLVARHHNCPFVRARRTRNVRDDKPAVERPEVWRQMVGCLLTTRNNSGPGSPVAEFIRTRPFPLAYERCLENDQDVRGFTSRVLSALARRFRRNNIISGQVASNWRRLQSGIWQSTMQALENLRQNQNIATERKTADFVDKNFEGFGPKQSRNFLQEIGLTQYEIPIDSRIIGWLNDDLALNVRLSGAALTDLGLYRFVLDAIQKLCEASGVLPCVLDASVFCAADRCRWTEEIVSNL